MFEDITIGFGEHEFDLAQLLIGAGVLLIGIFIVWLLSRTLLRGYFRRRKVDEGRQYSLTQLFRYFFYTVVALTAIQVAGIQLTVMWAAGAALLVGIGIGLQQTFNDFMSGIILLVEGSIEKGDWLLIGDLEAKVLRIGLRSSVVETRRRIKIIVPNSKITVENVINMSHENDFVRYQIAVGVAYGSDTRLVEQILVDCAIEHDGSLKEPRPFVRFTDFGDSALLFELHFWSDQFQRIHDVKSELRFTIDQRFREQGVTIPFPQRDLHLRSGFESMGGRAADGILALPRKRNAAFESDRGAFSRIP